MNEIERRLRELASRLSEWFSSNSQTARQRGADGVQQAATRAKDFRASERGQRAASKVNDLRSTETAKKAEAALADLRQREPVKKAEESARKVVHDLFSGTAGTTGDH
jgi:hypothetical protein